MPAELNDKPKEIELMDDRAMFYVPHNALEATLTFKIYLNGEVQTVYRNLTQDELQEAVRKAAEGYIDEDDVFTLTDEGRAYAEQLSRSHF